MKKMITLFVGCLILGACVVEQSPVDKFLHGESPTGYDLKKLKLDMDKNKHSVFAIVTPSTYYNYAFTNDKNTMYSFEMEDSKVRTGMYGYCLKKDENCKQLFETLRDKERCVVELDVWYPNKVFRDRTPNENHAEIGNITIHRCSK